jgi:hypothetical protein
LYHNTSESWILNLTSDLHNLKLSNNQEIAPHLIRLKDMCNKLESLGKTLEEKEFVHIILCSLPISYQPFIRGLDTSDKITTIYVANITSNLLQEEQSLEKEREPFNDESRALVSKGRSTQYTKKSNDKIGQFSKQLEEKKHPYRFNNNCHCCGKSGHYVKDCRKKKWDMQQRKHKFSSHKNSIG